LCRRIGEGEARLRAAEKGRKWTGGEAKIDGWEEEKNGTGKGRLGKAVFRRPRAVAMTKKKRRTDFRQVSLTNKTTTPKGGSQTRKNRLGGHRATGTTNIFDQRKGKGINGQPHRLRGEKVSGPLPWPSS